MRSGDVYKQETETTPNPQPPGTDRNRRGTQRCSGSSGPAGPTARQSPEVLRARDARSADRNGIRRHAGNDYAHAAFLRRRRRGKHWPGRAGTVGDLRASEVLRAEFLDRAARNSKWRGHAQVRRTVDIVEVDEDYFE